MCTVLESAAQAAAIVDGREKGREVEKDALMDRAGQARQIDCLEAWYRRPGSNGGPPDPQSGALTY